mmetsp:Transcript_11127/g.25771  ORF Transcript_11127/g.25771 Transcript_11127/m.25771 type:complete len:295 (-) Transcript_11127:46-930(-)
MGDESNGSDLLDELDTDNGGVLTLLKKQHNCHCYISTMTASQRLVCDEGVLFGPGKAKEHLKNLSSKRTSFSSSSILPPPNFASTLETLLNQGITYSWKWTGTTAVRTWSLSEFWEMATWPRIVGGDVRFGFPTLGNVDEDEEYYRFKEEVEEETAPPDDSVSNNPFVKEVLGTNDLTREIVANQKNCILFLSAKFCRTCRYLTPQFNRLARINGEDIVFAKADTSLPKGKILGKELQIEAVPAFVLFSKGNRYGPVLSVNRLPNKKMDFAIKSLQSGMEWDEEAYETIVSKQN